VLRDRQRERDALDNLLDGLKRGHSGALVVRGDAGVGKSTLLEYVVENASEMRVLRATGIESEMQLAYAALHQLCAPIVDRIEHLPKPQANALAITFGLSDGMAPDRFLVGLSVLGLLSDAAAERPIVCIIEDAQWLDRPSGELLAFVARRLVAESVVMLFSTREEDEILRRVPELVVEGLSDADARELLTSTLHWPVDELVLDQIVAEARGNPLALLELPRGLTPAQLAGGFRVTERPLPARLEQTFVSRYETLPDETQRLLVLASADPTGDPTIFWRAARQLGIRRAALQSEDTAGLLEVGARVQFRHPLVRSALYRLAPAEQKRESHRALAEATDPERDPDRRAWHSAAATLDTDEEVAVDLERAAERAQARGGLAAAAAFLERATALTPDPMRRSTRALAATRTHLQAGSFDAASSLLAVADAQSADDVVRARSRLMHAEIVFLSQRGGDAPLMLLEAARDLEAVDADLARSTYLEAISAAMFAGRLARGATAADVSRAALAGPAPTGPPRPSDLLLQALATRFTDGYTAAAPALKVAVRAFLTESSLPYDQSRWLWFATYAALHLWDDASAMALSTRHLEIVREAGALTALPLVLASRSSILGFMGHMAEATAAEEELRAATDATGIATVPYGSITLAGLKGREAELSELIQDTVRDAESRGEGFVLTFASFVSGHLNNGLGRYGTAVNALGSPERFYEEFPGVWALDEVVEAAARSGQKALASRAFDLLSETTQAAGTDWALGMEVRCRALLGEGEDVDDLYREAIERLGRTLFRIQEGRSHLLYGEWLRRERRRLEARQQLRTALEMFTAIGAEAFVGRAERELLATGEKARKRTLATIHDLTPQEAEVARLARDGHSNPEIGARLFISSKTVEYHLHKVFDKLEIDSRMQLARAMPADAGVTAHA
jgi:DNA-binding CsgD family transcriptional regulator